MTLMFSRNIFISFLFLKKGDVTVCDIGSLTFLLRHQHHSNHLTGHVFRFLLGLLGIFFLFYQSRVILSLSEYCLFVLPTNDVTGTPSSG